MIRFISFFAILLALLCYKPVLAQSLNESFDDVTTLAGNGWVLTNASVAVGSRSWAQGSPASFGCFDAYDGAPNAYISANYNSTGNTGTISDWVLTPNRTFRNGDVITFYTCKISPDQHPDRLEVRLSTNGASSSVGSGNSVGDFTTLLLSVNPTLALNVYPTTWTLYTITISGLPAPTSGRVGFRYYVTNAGNAGINSDYIGIDAFTYTPYVCPGFTLSPSSSALTGGRAGSSYSASVSQIGALGAPTFAITAGALPPGLTISSAGNISGTPTATGTFNFTVTASDASGCSGARSYSITAVCPSNPTSLSFTDLCSNDSPLTLTEGTPAGGTYSGIGVSGGTFDPTAGTQSITYDYTDPYGCAFSSTATMNVNTAPTVSISGVGPLCTNDALATLSGSPAGGTYAGTGVSSNTFDPASGTQSVTYSYTDANGCSNTGNTTITVNNEPTVTASTPAAVCKDASAVTLSFGSPAGGSYSGTNVSAGLFTPSTAGSNSITYSYTDANGCTSTAGTSITVNQLPVVTAAALPNACQGSGNVTLTGGSPAGGVYGGTNVSAGLFTPSTAGSNTITYSYTDANNCTATASTSIHVSICTAITESLVVPGLKYFPNPTNGILLVEFDQNYPSNVQIQITDMQGRKCVTDNQNSSSRTFDLSAFPKGIYMLELRGDEKVAYYKILVQ